MGSFAVMGITIVKYISTIIQLLVIGSVMANLLGADPNNPIVRMLAQTTEPMCRPFRKLTSKIPGPLDWSPLVLIMIVITIEKGLVHFLGTLTQ